MALVLLAFRQGRTIEFWPPKIGSRPPAARAADCGERDDRPAPVPDLPGPASGMVRVYDVADAGQFYREIAPNYDARNSARLLATHMEVITRIDQAQKAKPD